MLLEDFYPINEEGLIVPGVNTTKDVKPGEIKRQAAKFGFSVDENGIPPLISKDSVVSTLPKVEASEQTGAASPLTYPGTKKWQAMKKRAAPGTDEWFRTWFSRPYLTNGTK